MSLILKAQRFATERHKGQWRDTAPGLPPVMYIEHPREVAGIVERVAGKSYVAVSAAWLHDVIEDCGVSRGELIGLFGDGIAETVMELTDDPRLSKIERKRMQIIHAPAMSYAARVVKVADKISNLRSMPTSGWSRSAVEAYVEHATLVVDGCLSPRNEVVREPLRKMFNEAVVMAMAASVFFGVDR